MPSLTEKSLFLILAFLVGIIISIGIYSRILYNQNQNLISQINSLNSQIKIAKLEQQNLENSILNQNKEIEKNKVNLDEKAKELETWKNKPAEIKYQEVIKYKEVKSNECSDVKNVVDALRSTSF